VLCDYAAGTGHVILTDETMLDTSNTAWEGRAAFMTSGKIEYVLPAPMGSWAPAIECMLYRLPCTTPGCDPNMQPPLPTQPCEFREYGTSVARFDPGPTNDGIPFKCAAGLIGNSQNAIDQSSSRCSGSCPAGYFCVAGSTAGTPCRVGTYCSTGSGYETSCRPGTYGQRPMLTSQDECTACEPGYWCFSGSRIACGRGTYQPALNAEYAQACAGCPRYSTTAAEASASLDQCVCEAGFVAVNASGGTFTCQCERGSGLITNAEGASRCERCGSRDSNVAHPHVLRVLLPIPMCCACQLR
jgi:hypothetical protein